MRKVTQLIIFLVLICGCREITNEQHDIQRTIGKEVKLDSINTVCHNGDTLTVNQLFNLFEYVAIVYVKDLCSPCVEKFNSWSKWNKDVHDGNYTTLFIIQGYDYESFISKVNQTYKNSSYYYYTMDYFFEYEENNTHIPTWILNTSMLIDRKRVIKIIGAPYVNSDMNKIYLSYFRIKD